MKLPEIKVGNKVITFKLTVDRAIRLKFEEEFKDLIINKAQSIKVKARKNAKLISLEKMINQRRKNIRNKCSDISDLPLDLAV